MITVQEKKNIEVSGTVLDQADYHIDPNAIPHITALLRNLYADPVKAVLREYIANAVDAHTEAGIPDKEIEIHLPTDLQQWFSVRDFGNGLNVEDTKRLLYGYGASGDAKRVSNNQIGGFGIGCKCAFAITESFTYTIWHEGKRRIWTCYLDEQDVGQAMLLSEEDSNEPNGMLIKVPFDTQNIKVYQIQDALNELLMFLHGSFRLIGSQYWLPEVPVPLLEQKGNCKVNGVNTPITYQFFKNGEVKKLPAIIVGGTSYTISKENLKEALDIDNVSYKEYEEITRLTDQVAVHVPIGFLQLAPSREELQYSGRTKKMLKHIFTQLSTKEFRKNLMTQIKKKTTGKTVLDRRAQSELLGLRLTEGNSSPKEGFFLYPSQVEEFDVKTVTQLAWDNSGSIRSMRSEKHEDWNTKNSDGSEKTWTVFSSVELDFNRENSINVVILVDKMPSETSLRQLVARTVTMYKTKDTTQTIHNMTVAVLKKADTKNVNWLTDGSIKTHKESEIPDEIDHSLFASQKTTGRNRSTYKTKSTALGTKFLRLGKSKTSNESGGGVYWSAQPAKDTERGMWVEIEAYKILGPQDRKLILPETMLEVLHNPDNKNPLLKLIPELKDGLLGVRSANKTKALEESKEFINLWDLLKQRWDKHVKNKSLNVEALITTATIEDLKNESPGFDQLIKMLTTNEHYEKLAQTRTLKRILKSITLNTVTQNWLDVLQILKEVVCRRVYGGLLYALLIQHKEVNMFDVSTVNKPAAKRLTSIATTHQKRWIEPAYMLEGISKKTDEKLEPSVIESLLMSIALNFPILTTQTSLSDLWTNYGNLEIPRSLYTFPSEKAINALKPRNLQIQLAGMLKTDSELIKFLVNQARKSTTTNNKKNKLETL